MSEIKWIKITTDMFDNRKIKHLRKLPEGNNIVLIWVMLLTMAGRCNAGGMIFLTEKIPYTTKMLADELNFEENTIRIALQALEQLDMITIEENYLNVSGWDIHQNVEGMEKVREQNRIRKRKQRDRERKALEDKENETVTQCHVTVTQQTKTKNKNIDKDIESSTTTIEQTVEVVVDKYHAICNSLPKVKKISETLRNNIAEKLQLYSMSDFEMAFTMAENSSFIKKGGSNGKCFFNLEWIMKDDHFEKLINGTYEERFKSNGFDYFAEEGNRRNFDTIVNGGSST